MSDAAQEATQPDNSARRGLPEHLRQHQWTTDSARRAQRKAVEARKRNRDEALRPVPGLALSAPNETAAVAWSAVAVLLGKVAAKPPTLRSGADAAAFLSGMVDVVDRLTVLARAASAPGAGSRVIGATSTDLANLVTALRTATSSVSASETTEATGRAVVDVAARDAGAVDDVAEPDDEPELPQPTGAGPPAGSEPPPPPR